MTSGAIGAVAHAAAATASTGTTAIIAAIVAAAVSLVALWINGVRQERQRRREFYAAALEATFAYREFAYAVRRRRHDQPEAERVRISEAMREVQRDIARHDALMRIERAANVAAQYRALVVKTREVAGGYIRSAWESRPITGDGEMSISGLDFSALDGFVTAFLEAVAEDLAWWRVWR